MQYKFVVYFLFKSPGKFTFDLNLQQILLRSPSYFLYSSYYKIFGWNIFVHTDLSLTLLLTNDFSSNHKNLYDICMHANSVLFCAYHEKLDCFAQFFLTTAWIGRRRRCTALHPPPFGSTNASETLKTNNRPYYYQMKIFFDYLLFSNGLFPKKPPCESGMI